GLDWSNIAGTGASALPDIPVWTITVDPRNNNLYVGTDDGVWVSPGGTGEWQPFGTGMPSVQVTDLVLNQSLNTLTAATYGRGAFQLFLDDAQADTGAVRVLSGSSTWTGSVKLV